MMNSTQEYNSTEEQVTVKDHKRWAHCPEHLPPEIVLVEDDPQVRGVWLTVALRMRFRFAMYSNPEEFMEDLPFFVDGTQFYLDQDFGYRRGLGIQLSKAIRRIHLKSNVFLVTSYPREIFGREISIGVLDDVYSKYPWPFTVSNARPF